MKTKNKISRLDYMDTARGLAILLVVIGHYPKTGGGIITWLSSFHMPLFFILTGMLSMYTLEAEKPVKEFLFKKARTILLPYATFSLIIMILRLVYEFYKTSNFSIATITEDFMMTMTLSGISVLWFLPVLFFAQILFYLVLKFRGRNVSYMVAIVSLLISIIGNRYYQSFFGETDVFSYKIIALLLLVILRILLAYAFIAAGFLFQTYFPPKKIFSLMELLITFLFLLFGIAVSLSNIRVDMRTMTLGNEGLFLIGALTSSLAVVLLFRNFDVFKYPGKKVFAYIGRNSLVIMATHVDFFVMLAALKLSELVQIEYPMIQFIVETACVIVVITVLEMALVYGYQHYLYFLIGRNKPRRRFKVISSKE